ncbi:hypothetical protein EV384_5324 [Micromonospora kangleipakensis]|uniref:SWIM-type domain-containing protein n=1 Tax=Micromonospora kangleipakensis TaxID=1077942 RepID=A0A4Q8BFB1_9ACTN|nr:hypothetical protein [Micromonospora kangleipakensis]RZU76657.1 hypothetical protein EV384_5324 [Micromonospora kangleipakensis]
MSTDQVTTRGDLLALTPESLAALTNRGLVKRATKELDRTGSAVVVDADGTVRGTFPDGTSSSLPTGGLSSGTCSCDASGVCRHLIGLVLAYQRHQGVTPPAEGTGSVSATASEVTYWSPGAFTDEQLTGHIGARLVAAARRAEHAGYLARVRRPTPVDPVPSVELGSATVRFLVPHDLGFVHTDAAAGTRDDVVALAVWAFRVADERAPDVPEVQVEVGGRGNEGGSGLEPTLVLADTVLRDGAVHLGPGIAAALADQERRLDTAGLRWPLLAVGELSEQLTAYQERSARYRPEALAGLILELHARHRAVVNGGASLRARVLGTEEAAETPLRRVRLDSLGARVSAVGEQRVVEIFYAHADTATVLVVRRSWDGDADGATLARRRVASATVGALAAGNLVTESAVRSASRAVRLATSRVAQTTVTPSQGRWDTLPDTLVVRDIKALAAELDALPPRVVRPRIEAELVRVVQVAQVLNVTYSPGQQRLDAIVVDTHGTPATVTATHSVAAPGRLDAIAAALAGTHGPILYISGTVHRSGGRVVIDPLAFSIDGALVVPELAPAAATHLESDPNDDPGGLAAALEDGRTLLTNVAHQGLLHLPATYPDRLRGAARGLTRLGLHRVAAAVEYFAATLGPDPGEVAVRAWVDAYLRVDVALDLC